MEFSGIFAALTTPFSENGSVSLEDLKHNIERYNATELAGYVVLGSTGEAVMLTRPEMESILAAARGVAGKNKTLIAGTGAESTAETIDRCKRAADLDYAAALVKTPHYYKSMYKPDVLVAHYLRVADQSPIPVLLYSIPQFTGIALEATEVAALADHPNIFGIKDSSGDLQRLAEITASVPAKFQVLVGSASTLVPSLALRARGGILALACALPEKCVELFQLFRQGEQEKAREFQVVLAKASQAIVSELGIAGVKYVMDQRGYCGGLARLPLRALHHEEKARLNELLAALEPAHFTA